VSESITQEVEDGLPQKFNDYLCAQKVVHSVLYERKLAVHFLDVQIDDSDAAGISVTMYGVAPSKNIIDLANGAAASVPGVKNVKSAIQMVEDFNFSMGISK
jgi:hypothetical protein